MRLPVAKVAAEEELSSMKQSMAMMSSQHFLEVKRLRDHAVKEQAAAVAAAIGAADGPHQPGATAIPASRRRSLSSGCILVNYAGRNIIPGVRLCRSPSVFLQAHAATYSCVFSNHFVAMPACLGGARLCDMSPACSKCDAVCGIAVKAVMNVIGYDAGSPSGNGVPAHRLEIQLHQKEGQLAEQSARLQAQVQHRAVLL